MTGEGRGQVGDGQDDAVQSVRVEIFGEEYLIRTDMDEEYTRRCADFVDEAIRDAHLDLHVSEPHKAAILAALEITDRYFRQREQAGEKRRDIAKRIRALRERISSVIEAQGGGLGGDGPKE